MVGTAFESALQAGMAAQRLLAGDAVTVSRGATTITVSDAIQTSTRFEVLDGSGLAAVVEAVEWLIDVNAYTLGEPAIGDLIARVIDGTTYTYTVEHPGQGINVFEYSDTSRTQYRIRSREDGATAYTVTKPNGFDISGTEIRYD